MRTFAHSNDVRWDAHQVLGYWWNCSLQRASSCLNFPSFRGCLAPTNSFWALPVASNISQFEWSVSCQTRLHSNLGLTRGTRPIFSPSQATLSIWTFESIRGYSYPIFTPASLLLDLSFRRMRSGQENFFGVLLRDVIPWQFLLALWVLFYEEIVQAKFESLDSDLFSKQTEMLLHALRARCSIRVFISADSENDRTESARARHLRRGELRLNRS